MKCIYTLLAFLISLSWIQAQSLDTATWKVNTSIYAPDDNMTITAVVEIEGEESRDTNDIVAAFIGTECRGVARPTYVEALDRYILTIFVYGGESEDQLTFLIYDDGTQRVLPVLDTLDYQDQLNLGSLESPFRLRSVRISIAFDTEDVLCATDTFGYAIARVNGGKPPYQYLWSTGETTDSIGNLGPGRYYLTLTDANNIENVDSIDILNLNKNVEEPILLVAPDTEVCQGTNGYIFAQTNELDSPLYYHWYDIFGNRIHTGRFLELRALNASVEITCQTELRTCLSERVSTSILVFPLPDASFSASERVVREEQVVSFVPTVQQNDLSYFWDFGDGATADSMLARHQYTVRGFYEVSLTVTSPDGCSATSRLTIRVEEGLAVLLTDTPPACATDSTGILVAQVFNGAPPFQFVWNTGDTTAELRGLFPGFYRVTVTDDEGRVGVAEINLKSRIVELTAPQVTLNGRLPYCPGDDIQLSAFSNIPEAQMYWYDSETAQSPLFIGNPLQQFKAVDSTELWVESRVAGCASPTRTRIEIPVLGPDAGFSVSDQVVMVSEVINLAPDTVISGYQYDWNLGDGRQLNYVENGSIGGLSHFYRLEGIYSISLEVTTPGGCKATTSKIVQVEDDLVVNFEVSAPACPSDSTGIIIALAQNGRAPFNYQWSNGGTTKEIRGLLPGFYRLTITDALGRVGTAQINLQSELLELPAPEVVLNGNRPYCPGDDLQVTAFSAVAEAQYIWYNAAGERIFAGNPLIVFDAQVGQTLYVETRLGQCVSATRTRIEVPVYEPYASFSYFAVNFPTPVNPDFVNTGEELVFSPDSIVSGYRYEWNFGDGRQVVIDSESEGRPPVVASPIVRHTYADTGTYLVKLIVTTPKGCVREFEREVKVLRLRVLFTKDDAYCQADTFAWVKAHITGGRTPYRLEWSTGSQEDSIGHLGIGRYTLKVTDATGFSLLTAVDIINRQVDIEEPRISAAPGQAVCVGSETYLFAQAPPQSEPTTFFWYNVLNNPLGEGRVLNLGEVVSPTLVYAQTQVRGCRSEPVSFSLNTLETPNAAFSITERVPRVDQQVGFFPAQINSRYSYNWSFGDGTSSNASLPVHTYSLKGFYEVKLELTAPGGCKDEFRITLRVEEEDAIIIQDEDLIVLLEVNNVDCPADQSGSVQVQVLEGQPPFRYRWNTGATTSSIRRLRPGRYTVTVTDGRDKQVIAEANVEALNENIPVAEVLVNGGSVVCWGSSVQLNAYVENLEGAEFFWYDAPIGGRLLHTGEQWEIPELKNRTTYYVETRLGSCVSGQRRAVEINPQQVFAQMEVGAFRLQLGDTLKVEARVKDPAYRYRWELGNGETIESANPVLRYVYRKEGEYRLKLTVLSGACQASSEVSILVVSEELAVFFDSTPPQCADDASGIIVAQVLGGDAPYTYLWSTGQRSGALSGLKAGAYRLTVTDSRGRQTVGTLALNSRLGALPAPQLVLNGDRPYCPGEDVQISASAEGVPGAEFYWYDGANPTRLLYTGNPLIQFAVKESRSFFVETRLGACASAQRSFVEVPVDGPDAGFETTSDRSTPGTEIGFTPNEIEGDYRYSWDFGDGATAEVAVSTHAYAAAGRYVATLRVSTPEGCQSESSQIIIIEEAGVIAAAFQHQDVECRGDRNGEIVASGLSGTAPYRYLWSTGQEGSRLSGLGEGTYYVTITDARGAQVIDSVQIGSRVGEVLPAGAVSTMGDTVCVGRDVTLLAYSPQEGVSFFWYDAPGGGREVARGNQFRQSGLQSDQLFYLESRIGQCISPQRTPVRLTVENPNKGFDADATAVVMGNSVSFTPKVNQFNYQYQWFFGDGGASQLPSPTHTYTTPGQYDVQLIVVSERGCVGLQSRPAYITVLSDTEFTATLDVQPLACTGDSSGVIRARAFNGEAPYQFLWNTGSEMPEIRDLKEGSYQVTVTDASGRQVVRQVELRSLGRAPQMPVLSPETEGVLCAGTRTTLRALSAEAETYEWFDALGELVYVGANLVINELKDNTRYEVQARSGGCVSPRAEIALQVSKPNAEFRVLSGTTLVLGEELRLRPQDSTLASYRWTFGDGSTSTAREARYVYTREGQYDVSLTVRDAQGCQQTRNAVRLVSVVSQTTLSVRVQSRGVLCEADHTGEVLLEGLGGVPPYRFEWFDGSTQPQKTELSAGVYAFTITDGRGVQRRDSARVENLAAEIPAPQVEINGKQTVCANVPVNLLALNTAYPAAESRWYSSLEEQEARQNGRLLPLPALSQDTTLFVEAMINGCVSQRRLVTVRVQKPDAGFSVQPSRTLKEGELVQFVPATARADYRYEWSFGDGGWSRRMEPYYFYNVQGLFDVSLKVTDAQGCAWQQMSPQYMQVSAPPGARQVEDRGEQSTDLPLSRSAGELKAFPNPFGEELQVLFKPLNDGRYRLRLLDALGRDQAGWTLENAQAGGVELIQISESLGQLQPGFFVLMVEGEDGSYSQLKLLHVR